MKIVIPGGAGLMGRVITRDLLENPRLGSVLVIDLNREAASSVFEKIDDERLRIEEIQAKDWDRLTELISGSDVVINSAPYTENLDMMRACLRAGVHYLDLGGLFHNTRSQMELHDEFKEAGLTAILGCGSTPGITNIMAAYVCENLHEVESVNVKIGCADFAAESAPLSFPYSLDTILDEFSLNPIIFLDGEFIEVAPLSGEEEVRFPEPVGVGRACYTLHSEVATFPVSFKDKGIRNSSFKIAFPRDFYQKLKFLVELGFARKEIQNICGVEITPRQFILSLLSSFSVQEGDPDDFDVIRVEVAGKKEHRRVECLMECFARPHSRWNVSASSLDTAVPASIIAQMIARGEIRKRGVFPPELCVEPMPFFEELALRELKVHAMFKEILS